MRTSLTAAILPLLLASACQPEPTNSADEVASTPEVAVTEEAGEECWAFATYELPQSRETAELSLAGIGPVRLGMSWAELVRAGLEPEAVDGGVAVGPYRAALAPADGGPIESVFVRLGDLPEGLEVGGKLLKNESTSLQQLADAVGSCEPIEPNIGQASTTCHDGRVELSGAGPVGGLLTITVKTS